MSSSTKTARPPGPRPASKKAQAEAARTRLRRQHLIWATALLGVAAVVTLGLLTSRPATSTASRIAPDFTLTTTDGTSVSLAALRGAPVLLYFNEGAGCGACTQQMAEIEKNPGFAQAGITVLPIVMNTAAQIRPDLQRYGVTTHYLLDDGTVSAEYDALGTGMHEGLPGHGFILIDANGVQEWQGNYPSMWIAPADLLKEVTSRL